MLALLAFYLACSTPCDKNDYFAPLLIIEAIVPLLLRFFLFKLCHSPVQLNDQNLRWKKEQRVRAELTTGAQSPDTGC